MTKKQQEAVLLKIETIHKEFDQRLDAIEKVLILQEENLRTHMKRSDNLEKLVDKLRAEDIKSLTTHVNMVEGGLKLLGVISLIIGILVPIISALVFFFR